VLGAYVRKKSEGKGKKLTRGKTRRGEREKKMKKNSFMWGGKLFLIHVGAKKKKGGVKHRLAWYQRKRKKKTKPAVGGRGRSRGEDRGTKTFRQGRRKKKTWSRTEKKRGCKKRRRQGKGRPGETPVPVTKKRASPHGKEAVKGKKSQMTASPCYSNKED